MLQPNTEAGHYQYKVKREKPDRISNILKDEGFSSRLITSIKKKGELLLNGSHTRFIDIAKPGDTIDVFLPVEGVNEEPIEGELNIVYEDDEVLIVNKQKEVVVHPTPGYEDITLSNIIADYYHKTGQKHKIRFVNRIDRDTTGIVVIAKNKYVHSYIQSQLASADKTYLALAEGAFEDTSGSITLPIHRPSEESIERVVSPEGKPSRTDYEVLKQTEDNALVKLKLKTGRTHQIRVHLKAIGHPIIGDPLYNPDSCENYGQSSQMLHAYKISLKLPKTGYHTFTAALPSDFLELESRLRLNIE